MVGCQRDHFTFICWVFFSAGIWHLARHHTAQHRDIYFSSQPKTSKRSKNEMLKHDLSKSQLIFSLPGFSRVIKVNNFLDFISVDYKAKVHVFYVNSFFKLWKLYEKLSLPMLWILIGIQNLVLTLISDIRLFLPLLTVLGFLFWWNIGSSHIVCQKIVFVKD